MTLDISKLNNIKYIPSNNQKKEVQNSAETKEQISFSGLFRGTPDYNVKVPMQYSKIGTTTLDNGMEIHEYKLANGQRVMIMPSDSPTLTLKTYVKTGAMNEKDDERGISHFMEHMMFNGTRGDNGYKKIEAGETFKAIEEMGGFANASTGYKTTDYIISLPQFNSDDFAKAVEIQSAMVCNPAFTDEMIEKEKGPVCSEINMASDAPYREVAMVSLKNLLNIKSTSADVITGTVENIQNLNKEKLFDYYNKNYCPANMTTVVTGNVNPDEAMQIISKNFRNTNVAKTEQLQEEFNPITKTVRADLFSPKATSTTGVLYFVGPKASDFKDTVACEAVTALLAYTGNSRLSTPLQHLNTSLDIGMEQLSNTRDRDNMIYMSYDTAEANSEKALKLIFDKLGNFVPPTQKELDNIKLLLKKNFEDTFESSISSNDLIGALSTDVSTSQLADYKKTVDSLTSEDLANAVKKYFDTSKTSVAIIHPQDVTKEQLNQNYQQAQTLSFKGHAIQNNDGTAAMSFKGISNPVSNNNTANPPSKDLKIFYPERLSEYILQNNTNIGLYDNQRGNGFIEYKIICDAPADVKPGVVDVLNEILSRGSAYKTLEQFGDAKSDNCASVSAGCTRSTLRGYTSFIPEKAGESIDLMKENMLAPRFTYEDFEAARQTVKENCLSAQDYSFDYLKREMFKNQHYGETKDEVLANIDTVTLNDVMGLYQYYLQNGKAVASVSAPFGKNPELKDVVFNKMSGFPTVKQNNYSLFESYKPVESSKVFQKETNKSQADVTLGYKYQMPDNLKDRMTINLLSYLLSRSGEIGLFETLREKEKLAYMVEARDLSYDNNGMLLCEILTTTVDDLTKKTSYENVQKSIDGFHRQINLLKEGQFSDKDFEKIKLQLKASLLSSSEKTDIKTDMLLDSLASKEGISHTNQMYETIDNITKQDVINMANYVFSGKPTYSVLANKATLEANADYLKGLEK